MKKKFTSLLVFVLLISMVLPAGTSFAAGKKPKLNMKKLNMTVGSTFSLRVYNAKKKHKITFTSSKPSIATVKTETQNARYASVSALAIGSSVITVTVKKGKKVVRNLKCRVRVSPNAVSIKFMKIRFLFLSPREQDLKPLLNQILLPKDRCLKVPMKVLPL